MAYSQEKQHILEDVDELDMSRKIKILRIIARLNIGGPAINTVLLTGGLNREEFESILVTGRIAKGEGDMSYWAEERGIRPIIIHELCRALNPWRDFIVFWRLFFLIRREKPDIIHTHTAKAGTLGRLSGILYNLLTVYCLLSTNKRGCKLVHTFHGHVLSGYFNKWLNGFFLFIERFLARFTDRIIVVSEVTRKDILSLGIGSEEKVKVIHLGFDLDKFFSIQPRAGQQLNIGIVGRLVPIKNHRMFLDAAELLLTEPRTPNPEPRFFIIGDGELRAELEDYAQRLGIQNRVEFTGWQRDLVKVYESLDIVALTSYNEGTPVSLIEAMVSARAVIATDVGGVRDLVTSQKSEVTSYQIFERGVLVKSEDTNSFAEGLKILVDDVALRQCLGVAGREFVRERFNSKRLIEDMEREYNRTLKISRHGGEKLEL